EGWLLCDVGEHGAGLPYLQRAVANGYFVAPTLSTSRQFDALRGDAAFRSLLADAEAGRQHPLPRLRGGGGRARGRPARARRVSRGWGRAAAWRVGPSFSLGNQNLDEHSGAAA